MKYKGILFFLICVITIIQDYLKSIFFLVHSLRFRPSSLQVRLSYWLTYFVDGTLFIGTVGCSVSIARVILPSFTCSRFFSILICYIVSVYVHFLVFLVCFVSSFKKKQSFLVPSPFGVWYLFKTSYTCNNINSFFSVYAFNLNIINTNFYLQLVIWFSDWCFTVRLSLGWFQTKVKDLLLAIKLLLIPRQKLT